jgi:hypothetical protein
VLLGELTLTTVTLCTLNKNNFSMFLINFVREKIMKTVAATLFALITSASFALADGCRKHGEDVVMFCMAGQAWNSETQQCVDTNA